MVISVVLPAPFSPTRAWMRPGRTDSEMSSLATFGPKALVMCRSSSSGVAMRRLPSGACTSVCVEHRGAGRPWRPAGTPRASERGRDLDLAVDHLLGVVLDLVLDV